MKVYEVVVSEWCIVVGEREKLLNCLDWWGIRCLIVNVCDSIYFLDV